MEYILSSHAKEKIERRKISLELINQVLRNPTQIIDDDGVKVYQSIIRIDDKKYLLRVFVNNQVVPNMVITVYLTNKIMKYFGDSYEN